MAGQVVALQAQLGVLMSGITHVDATIRIFHPGIDLEDLPEKLAPSPFTGFRGEIQRFILDELRKSDHSLSTFDLADRIMEKRGIDQSDAVLRSLIRKRTGHALTRLRNTGKVTSWRAHHSAPLEWEMA